MNQKGGLEDPQKSDLDGNHINDKKKRLQMEKCFRILQLEIERLKSQMSMKSTTSY